MKRQLQSINKPTASSSLLFALAENVHFGDRDWKNKSLERAVLSSLHEANTGLSENSVLASVKKFLGPSISTSDIKTAIQKLERDSALSYREKTYYLKEDTRLKLDSDRNEADKIVNSCEQRLAECARKHQTDTWIKWSDFITNLVIPMTSELGTRTFDLLKGVTPIGETRAGQNYWELFPENIRFAVRDTITEYLDPHNTEVRKHLLGYITNYTLVAAGGLSSAQIESLINLSGPVELEILLDTNVIFSILGLHKNPLNEATNALLALREDAFEKIDLNFYVLISTLEEAKNSLINARSRARAIQEAPNIASLIAVEQDFISGLVAAYILEKGKAKSRLLADDYFNLYIYGIEDLLEKREIKIIDDSETRNSPNVKHRTDNWMTFQQGKKTKPRRSVLHDVTAIETVRLKRGASTIKAISAKWWLVSLDLSLQSLERKDLAGGRSLRTVITPDELTQLMRFWIPRTAQMDQALVGAIRMPFAFYSYDKEVENRAERVLSALSALEGNENLTPDEAIMIFQDQVHRKTLDAESDNDVANSVKETVDKLNFDYRDKNETLQKENRELKKQIGSGAAVTTGNSRNGGNKLTKITRERDRLKGQVKHLQGQLENQSNGAKPTSVVETSEDKSISVIQDVARLGADKIIGYIRRTIYILLALLLVGMVILRHFSEVSLFENVFFYFSLIAGILTFLSLTPKPRNTLRDNISLKIEQNLMNDDKS